MKKFLIKFLMFVICAVCFYTAMILFAGSFLPRRWNKNINYNLPGNGYLYTRLKDADTSKNVDVLILGSSKAYMGYDVRIFKKHNLTAFNLGSPAQSFALTELLLKRYLDRFNPKLIIFDVFPTIFGKDGVGSALDVVSNAKIGTDILKMSLQINDIRVYNTLLYSYYRQSFILNKAYVEPERKDFGKYIKGGFVQSYNHSGYKVPNQVPKINIQTTSTQLEAFNRVILLLKSHKINYVLVQTPIDSSLYKSIQNNNELDKSIAKQGVYINLNKLLKFPHMLFVDDVHLNQEGVVKSNEFLISLLKEKKLLPGHL